MPAYAAAITKAKAEGQYVGNDGVDCGGFVTRLMIDSGFEPNYNYAGKLSDGAANVASGQHYVANAKRFKLSLNKIS